MDAQLKYRLTGAVILVLLAVLFVPELLTGPARPRPSTSGPEPAPTTAEGAPLRSYDIDLGDTSAAPSPEPTAEETPVPAAEPPATAADEPRAAPPRPAAPVVPSRPPPAAPPSSAAPPTEGFAVQVGSFSARSSADRLAADLRRRSFQAFVSQVRSGGKPMFRVRVGPVADRAAAQALAAKLKSAGQSGTVVPLP